ncbi:MAG: AarF/ABC1/UbiB kinase family protein [Akkermansiaceae bacterium]|nr:AarF/ABC1/UbiB kinase family protein [Akkermansiaceae bacterium]NNM29978.1 AarF/ABC1/UbiB kinase family protein [Akkermansiaceae bacterium]
MKLSSLPQFKRNAIRFEQIMRVLAKHGLAEWMRESDPEFLQRLLTSDEGEKLAGRPRPELIRMAITELGTTFIKLGQMLSTRVDLIGEDLAVELAKLQEDTPPDPPETVHETIERELGAPAREVFASFDETPLASASIAQVHRGTLPDGSRVVIKVQHAGIGKIIENDLDVLTAIAGIAEKYSRELRLYQPVRTLAEFRRNLIRELDFGREEQNLEQFRKNFEDDETVRIPAPYPDLSGKTVLTMEEIKGLSVSDRGELEAKGLDAREIARRGVNLFLEMIFRDRFYHADPHPGNLLVLPGNVIGLLDCGMVGYLDRGTQEGFEGLVEGFLLKDGDLLTDCALQLGSPPADLDRDELRGQIEVFIQDHLTGALKDLDLGMVLGSLATIIRHHRIILNPSVSRLIKVLIMLEGTGRRLHPDFKLAELFEPYYRKMTHRRHSPQNVMRRLRRSYRDWDALFKSLPRDLADLLRQARRGTLDVHLEHRRLDAVVNRVAYAMLTAALFLGSTLLWSQQIPPVAWGTSIPGVLGTFASVWLAFHLLRSIHRSGGIGKKPEG